MIHRSLSPDDPRQEVSEEAWLVWGEMSTEQTVMAWHKPGPSLDNQQYKHNCKVSGRNRQKFSQTGKITTRPLQIIVIKMTKENLISV